jgi:predicted transposase/invertase (TIGR01784 family)
MISSQSVEDIEMLATKTPEMGAAVARLKQLSEDERVQMIYESQELARMDESVRRKAAFAEGRVDGIAEGLSKGKMEVARNMLALGVSPDIISQSSGLSMDDIRRLAD